VSSLVPLARPNPVEDSPWRARHVLTQRSVLRARRAARVDNAAAGPWALRCALAFGLALGSAVASPKAQAEASVIVELKRADGSAADGIVRLTKGDEKLECTTQKGRCQLNAVPGGTYSVEVVQADKPAAKPKRVMIPPAGEVKLIVAAQ
jgi:hypothetical protein